MEHKIKEDALNPTKKAVEDLNKLSGMEFSVKEKQSPVYDYPDYILMLGDRQINDKPLHQSDFLTFIEGVMWGITISESSSWT